jgi:hypothetical protein
MKQKQWLKTTSQSPKIYRSPQRHFLWYDGQKKWGETFIEREGIMGLSNEDKTPDGISLREAYTKIKQWYKINTPLLTQDSSGILHTGGLVTQRNYSKYANAALDLVNSLPDESGLSEVEIRAILSEVIAGKLEWAYHESDGKYKMAAYAHAALKKANQPIFLTREDKDKLKSSSLYQFLSPHLRD